MYVLELWNMFVTALISLKSGCIVTKQCRYITCVDAEFDICEVLSAEGAASHDTVSGLWESPSSCTARVYISVKQEQLMK